MKDNIYIWKDVDVDVDVDAKTPASGTHTVGPHNKTTTWGTKNWSWEQIINNCDHLEAKGYYAFHTYDDARYPEYIILNLDESSKTDSKIRWVANEHNPAEKGWGYQDARIQLEVIATYNSVENLISFAFTASVTAYTEGSVHECFCRARTDEVHFEVDSANKTKKVSIKENNDKNK